MSYFKREDDRLAFEVKQEDIKNTDQAKNGSLVAKHIINVLNADRGERTWGRVKNALRAGYVGLLFASGADRLADGLTTRLDWQENSAEISSQFLIPSVLALYGASRVSLYFQNSNHGDAMERRRALIGQFGDSTDQADFATGVISTIGAHHEARLITNGATNDLPPTSEGSFDPLSHLLYTQEPKIPR